MRVLVLSLDHGDRRDYVVAVGAHKHTTEWFLCGYCRNGGMVEVDTVLTGSLEQWVERAAGPWPRIIGEHTVTIDTACDDHPAFVVGDCCNTTLLTAIGATPRPAFGRHKVAFTTTRTRADRDRFGRFTEPRTRATIYPATPYMVYEEDLGEHDRDRHLWFHHYPATRRNNKEEDR